MRPSNEILNEVHFPSAADIISHAQQSPHFAKRTRHVRMAGTQFDWKTEPSEGFTWAFTSVENEFDEVKRACAILSNFFKKRVQCNAYLTPPNSQGLPVHYDLHDVYVIQISGSKNWRLWPAFRKSVNMETLLFDEKGNLSEWTTHSKAEDVQLESGQQLYLKAGVPHLCVAGQETSLHLSFGIYND